MKRRYITCILFGTVIAMLLPGCAITQSMNGNSDSTHSAMEGRVQSEEVMPLYTEKSFSRVDYSGWKEQVLDASRDGRYILLQGDQGFKIVVLSRNGEKEREVSFSGAGGVCFSALENRNENTYLAGSDGKSAQVYRLNAQGNVEMVTSCESCQTVFDLMPGTQGDFYLLVGDVIENPAFAAAYRENIQLLHLDAEGNSTYVSTDAETEDIFALAEAEDGTMLMFSNQLTVDETRVCVYVLENGVAEQYDSFPMERAKLLAGTENCLYFSTDSDLYAYDPISQDLTFVAKWVNWGVNGAAVVGGSLLSADQILLWGNQKTWQVSPKETHEDTVTLRVGVLAPFELPVQEILDFQSAYPEYQIETVTFEDQNELNLAIASGEDLDLLQADEIDTTRYEKNDVFINLDAYLNEDNDLSSAAFYTKLWDMTRQDNALYTVMTGFTIQGLYGPRGTYGDEQSMSLEEFRQGAENSRFYETTVRENAITWLCSVAGFDQEGALSQEGQEELSQILDLCKGFPTNFEQVDFEISGADLPFQWLNLSSLPAVLAVENQGKTLWQTSELDFLGYPVSQGLAFTTTRSYGIFSTSSKQAEAWTLLRYLLLSGNEDSGIPMRRPTEVPLLDQLVSQVSCQALGYASPILEIIQEEATPCFDGDKTPQEAAEVIVNRVHIYIGEQQ